MSINISLSRQRVLMIDASTLEDRTRPALDGSIGSRLRYFSWPSWSNGSDRSLWHQAASRQQTLPTQTRMGRR